MVAEVLTEQSLTADNVNITGGLDNLNFHPGMMGGDFIPLLRAV